MNARFVEITAIFSSAGIEDFKKLPDDLTERAVFAKQFHEFNNTLEAAKIQGFTREQRSYPTEDGEASVTLAITHEQYLTLLQRYKELGSSGGTADGSIPFDIDTHITEIDTGKIDTDYMNSRFEKFLKELGGSDREAQQTTLTGLQRSFASLSQEEQKFAELLLHDIQRGDLEIDPAKSFRDYLAEYQVAALNEEVQLIVNALGVDAEKLTTLMNANATETNTDVSMS